MRFYTNFYKSGNWVKVRGYNDGVRFNYSIEYTPTLYVPSKTPSKFKTIDESYVQPIKVGNIEDAKEFFKKYEDVDNFAIYGSSLYEYVYINENFENDYDEAFIRIANIDIEVESDDGFPEPEYANKPIISITLSTKDKDGIRKYYVFGKQPYVVPDDKKSIVTYYNCGNEKVMLEKFIAFWEMCDFDIVTGWNVIYFDIPYLYKRILSLLGDDWVKRLSPTKYIKENRVKVNNREQLEYELVGMSTLDFQELYKKFTYTKQENYKLNTIARVELGEEKEDYSEYETLQQLYKNDYQKFIDYNIKDVYLVDALEDKMNLIVMAFALAYDAGVNYVDVFTQVRMWDVIIHNELIKKNIVIPQKVSVSKETQFTGAYVKETIPGLYRWIISFDLDALYPHLMMQYNISPDTLIEDEYTDVSINKVISREQKIESPHSVAANGYHFRKDKKGFLAEIMETKYEERKKYKKLMIEAKKELELVNQRIKEMSV